MYKRYCQLLSNRFLKKDIDTKLPQCCIRQCKIAVKMCMNDRPKWMKMRKGITIEDINAMDQPVPSSESEVASGSEESDDDEVSLSDAKEAREESVVASSGNEESDEDEVSLPDAKEARSTDLVASRPNRVSLDSHKMPHPQKRAFYQSDSSDDDEVPLVLTSQHARTNDSDSSDDSILDYKPSPLWKRKRVERSF